MPGVGGLLAALSLASVTGVTACSAPPTLRSGDVQDPIASALADQVGGGFRVTCPTGIPAQAGTSFTCSVIDESDGRTVTVTVTESDDAGRFAWRVVTPSPSASPSSGVTGSPS